MLRISEMNLLHLENLMISLADLNNSLTMVSSLVLSRPNLKLLNQNSLLSMRKKLKAEAVEFIVGSGATVVGRPLKELNLPKECLICAYVRGNEAYIPNGDSVLEAGDRAILFIRTPHAKNVMKFFEGNK